MPSNCRYRYKDGPTGDEFPMAESLKLTIQRTLPYWNDQIVPDVSKSDFSDIFINTQFGLVIWTLVRLRICCLSKGIQLEKRHIIQPYWMFTVALMFTMTPVRATLFLSHGGVTVCGRACILLYMSQ